MHQVHELTLEQNGYLARAHYLIKVYTEVAKFFNHVLFSAVLVIADVVRCYSNWDLWCS
jgi:hypothetical protein